MHCICDEIQRQGKPRWLIFDHFNKPGVTVPDDTVELVRELTKRAEGNMRSLLRVALLDFDATLPPEVNEVAPHETVKLFGPDDMVSVYKFEASARGIAIGEIDEREVADAVHRLWTALDQDPSANRKEQLRYLVRQFNNLLKTLEPAESG